MPCGAGIASSFAPEIQVTENAFCDDPPGTWWVTNPLSGSRGVSWTLLVTAITPNDPIGTLPGTFNIRIDVSDITSAFGPIFAAPLQTFEFTSEDLPITQIVSLAQEVWGPCKPYWFRCMINAASIPPGCGHPDIHVIFSGTPS